MAPVVVAEHLSKRYGARYAVQDVSFTMQAGEVLGLLGPNGSGKTTVLRMLAGYVRPSAGTAQIAGYDVVRDAVAARQQVGYVPEDVPLYTHMRVQEFLTCMGQIKGLTGTPLQHHLERVCAQLELASVWQAMIGTLSRGYRQRVALAQAVLNAPALLILDEPTNGLDPRQITEMRRLIQTLAATQAVLVTSHILSEVEQVAHRVAILLHGRLLALQTLRAADALPWLQLTLRGGPPDAVQACVRALPGMLDVVSADAADGEVATYRVQVRSLDHAEDLTAALVAQGFGVRTVQVLPTQLEAVFLQLTTPQAAP